MKNNSGWFLLAGAVVLGLCGTCVCLGVMAYGFFALAESTVTSEGEFRGFWGVRRGGRGGARVGGGLVAGVGAGVGVLRSV
jgi:hypothetical protein